ncbi:MAG: TetR/AcrR family transcriptional regulator [Lentisphaerae bacterium]|nr:TetR/AcrR family transcriptional regulator [Lentisphaerota bacterium]
MATRRKLLEAARSVFSEKGFDLARIDDITERADVGKGTFYNYYTTKEEIIQELVAKLLKDLIKNLKEDCKTITDLTELLDSIMATHIKFFSNRWEDFVLFFQGRTNLTLERDNAAIEKPFVNYLGQIERMIKTVLHQKPSQNVLRRIACAVAGFVSGYYSFAVIASEEDDVDAVFRSLRGAMVASLERFTKEAITSAKKE